MIHSRTEPRRYGSEDHADGEAHAKPVRTDHIPWDSLWHEDGEVNERKSCGKWWIQLVRMVNRTIIHT